MRERKRKREREREREQRSKDPTLDFFIELISLTFNNNTIKFQLPKCIEWGFLDSGECRTRSDCTYVQSDLDLHSSEK